MGKNTVTIQFAINGEEKAVEIPAGISALSLIRDILGLKGAKEGCGIGECGACTIVVNGKAVNSCLMFANSYLNNFCHGPSPDIFFLKYNDIMILNQ